MVERQMRGSILKVGSFWYSAWVDAGQPNLNRLKSIAQSEPENSKTDSLDNRKGIIGRSED
jgi:protein tyrosine phosphatase